MVFVDSIEPLMLKGANGYTSYPSSRVVLISVAEKTESARKIWKRKAICLQN